MVHIYMKNRTALKLLTVLVVTFIKCSKGVVTKGRPQRRKLRLQWSRAQDETCSPNTEELKQRKNAKSDEHATRHARIQPEAGTKDIGTHSKVKYLTLEPCALYRNLKDIGTHSKIEFCTSWASSTPAWRANSGH